MKEVSFAIVGCGRIGYRHATIVEGLEEARLVAFCDVLADYPAARAFPHVPRFVNINEMLTSDIPIDVVSVCSPNGLHAEHALAAIAKGKHVLCEKPLALTRRDVESIIHASLHASRKVFCVMQNRYSPPAVWLKNLIEQELLGAIYLIAINCYWNRDQRYYRPGDWHGTLALDGGPLFTQFSHFIDLVYWVFGDLRIDYAQFDRFSRNKLTEFEDSGFVAFSLVNGGKGAMHYTTAVWDKNMESSIVVIGEKGSLKIGGQYMNEVDYCHIDRYQMPDLPPSNPPNNYGPFQGSAANHHYVIENVVESLLHQKPISTNALEGMKVVEIIERIYEWRK